MKICQVSQDCHRCMKECKSSSFLLFLTFCEVPCVSLITFPLLAALYPLSSLSSSPTSVVWSFLHPYCCYGVALPPTRLKALRSAASIDPGPTRLPPTSYRSQTPDRDPPLSSKARWKNWITPPEPILRRELRGRRGCMFTSVHLHRFGVASLIFILLKKQLSHIKGKKKKSKKRHKFVLMQSEPLASFLKHLFFLSLLLGLQATNKDGSYLWEMPKSVILYLLSGSGFLSFFIWA